VSPHFKWLLLGIGVLMLLFLGAAVYLATRAVQTEATNELSCNCTHIIALLTGGFVGLAGGKTV
jgi:multisubunit Na+/H+ antiporter MnhB subunit